MLAVLRLFEGSYKFDLFQTLRNNAQQHAATCNRVCKQRQREHQTILGVVGDNVASVFTGLKL